MKWKKGGHLSALVFDPPMTLVILAGKWTDRATVKLPCQCRFIHGRGVEGGGIGLTVQKDRCHHCLLLRCYWVTFAAPKAPNSFRSEPQDEAKTLRAFKNDLSERVCGTTESYVEPLIGSLRILSQVINFPTVPH